MSSFRVSIIIPIYNVEPYIEDCLQSVANQTMTEGVECILVDDCGTDNSIQIAQGFVDTYQGNISFTILHHEHNRGLSAARNTGIKAAQGEYVYFLDSDDIISKDCICLLYSYVIDYGEVDLVQGSFTNEKELMNQKGDIVFPVLSYNKKEIKSFLLLYHGDIVKAQNRLVRRNLITEKALLFKEGIIHEDNHWTFFLAKKVNSMAFCKTRTYFHRNNPYSITHSFNLNKESSSYRVIIEDFCNNIDSLLVGHQKELILSVLLTIINRGLYSSKTERTYLVNCLKQECTRFENLILDVILQDVLGKWLSKEIRHFLIRLYKWND